MQLIYLIGPYRGSTPHIVHNNIEAARATAAEVWKLGAVAVCPHTNTSYLDGVVPDEVFLRGLLELMAVCDIAYVFADIAKSEGSWQEVKTAQDLNMPVVWAFDALRELLNG